MAPGPVNDDAQAIVETLPNDSHTIGTSKWLSRVQATNAMGDGDTGWEGTIRKALLQEQAAGRGEEVDPTEVEDLRAAVGLVSATWRDRAQGQQRWLRHEEEPRSPPRAPWRHSLGELLEATYTHVFIVALLLVDLAATAADILKTIHNKSHDLDVCVDLVERCTSCIGHFERTPEWKWTYWTSIVILAILMLNVFGLVVAYGRSFFRNPLYLLDLVVVSTALALEILLDADTAGLIIVLTLWRIVRVAHGIFEVTDEAWEKNIHQLETQVKLVQEACDRDQELLREKDRRIAEQAERISQLEARVGESDGSRSSASE